MFATKNFYYRLIRYIIIGIKQLKGVFMNYRKLSGYIILLGFCILMFGTFQFMKNLPIKYKEPGNLFEDGTWKKFNAFIGDPTKNPMGVALINQDRESQRASAVKIFILGSIILFVGIAVYKSSISKNGRSKKPLHQSGQDSNGS